MAQTLLNSPAEIIQSLMIALELGTDPTLEDDWPIYCSAEPDSPDNCITVYDTTGTNDGRSMIDGELQSHNGFEVRVRSSSHSVGWLRADLIQTTLAMGVNQVTVAVDENRYTIPCIARIGDIMALGRNRPTSGHTLFTINAVVAIRQEV